MKVRCYSDVMVTKKSSTKKTTSKIKPGAKVDIYPNRMTFAVSALAGTTLVLFALVSSL